MADRAEGDAVQVVPTRPPLDLSNRVNLRAEIARAGLAPNQLVTYESPDYGWTNPLDSPAVQREVSSFMARLWEATTHA